MKSVKNSLTALALCCLLTLSSSAGIIHSDGYQPPQPPPCEASNSCPATPTMDSTNGEDADDGDSSLAFSLALIEALFLLIP